MKAFLIKIIIFQSFLLVFTSSCRSHSIKEFIIKGELPGLKNGVVELSIKRDWSFFPYRTVEIKGGQFEINGKIYNPTFATIKLIENGEVTDIRDLFIEEGLTTIQGKDLLSSAVIQGGDEQKLFSEFTKITSTLTNQRNQLLLKLNKQLDASERSDLTEQLSIINNQLKKATESFIQEHPRSFVSLYLVDHFDELDNGNPDQMSALFRTLGSSVRKTRIGQAIEGTINNRQKLPVGMEMKDFILPDQDGNRIQLSNIEGEAILLYFGASWCGPCKYEYPFLKRMYKNYHVKGLEIISVSLDKDKDKWMQLLSEEQFPWIQVSDLQGFQTEAAILYNVNAIPSNVLIDKSGKIRSVNRSGEDLLKRVLLLLD